MSSQQLLFPENIRTRLMKLYASRKHEWLSGDDWPLEINLGCPSEQHAINQQQTVLSWVATWREFRGPCEVTWRDRQWRRIGVQALPEKIIFLRPQDVADMIGEGVRWRRVKERHLSLVQRWPNVFTEMKVLFESLADFDDADFEILQSVVQWFIENPSSGLYPRQLPVVGAHTKWLEGRLQIVCALLASADGRGNYTATLPFLGLREPPVLWRMRILDSNIRQQVGGVEDMSATIGDLQQLLIRPSNIVIVENLQTFLAFQELQDTVVLLGMGFRVKEIANIHWVHSARCYYWGDLDTAGLAILDIARGVIPKLKSLLMDQQTLLAHQRLWVEERKQHPAQSLPHLTEEEMSVYRALKEQQWGTKVRLEQERLPWDTTWQTVSQAISGDLVATLE